MITARGEDTIGGRRWKGKARQVDVRAVEGAGGADGVVLPLDLVGGGIYDTAYTIPVKFSENQQQFSLQVDTGSSDLWVASKSCSTSSCAGTKGRLYDPATSRPTGQDFHIPYLQGSAAGPIVWDIVTLGGYSINNQALSAANDVDSEPLSPNFSGILGLALPLNSIISQKIPPVTTDASDGAAWASNLFSITPVSEAPAARFISLSLSRPGSAAIPSLLGIGHHPSALVPDPSLIKYASLVSDRNGVLFWKASVRAITVYVNGVAKPVALGMSSSGAAFPSAVLDSGVPTIFTTSSIANAIYGAINITPSSAGVYYVPCQTPLNLTITLDNRPEIPIHPLDLTAHPDDDNTSKFCVGLIQPADGVLGHANNAIGDMILGVPFLRNTYTVMAYTPPNRDGSFPDLNSNISTPAQRVSTNVSPMLGILPLTDPTRALAEFTTVRVLNQPISTAAPTPADTGSDANTKTVAVGGKKLAVGIVVLIGLLGLLAAVASLFAVRWLIMRRRYRRLAKARADEDSDLDRKTMLRLAHRMGSGALGSVPLVRGNAGGLGTDFTEDELREMRYKSWKALSDKASTDGTRTIGSDRTYVRGVDEFGVPDAGRWDEGATLVGATRPRQEEEARTHTRGMRSEVVPLVDATSPPASPESGHTRFPQQREYAMPEPASLPAHEQTRTQAQSLTESTAPPTVGAERSRTLSYGDTVEGIAASHAQFFSAESLPASPQPIPMPPGAVHPLPPARQESDMSRALDESDDEGIMGMPRLAGSERTQVAARSGDDGELGLDMGMAGVGSAARRANISLWGPRPSIDSLPFNRESLMSVSSVGSVDTVRPTQGAQQEWGRAI